MDITEQIENVTLARALDDADDVRAFVADCVALLGDGFHPDTEGSAYDAQVPGAGRVRLFTDRQARAFDALVARALHVADVVGLDMHVLAANLAG